MFVNNMQEKAEGNGSSCLHREQQLTPTPRIFNTGSPYNVPAGSQANLDELMAYYQKEAISAQEKRERKARAIYEGRESEESRFPHAEDKLPGPASAPS